MEAKKLSAETMDLVERDKKKVKGGDGGFNGETSRPVSYDDLVNPKDNSFLQRCCH